MYDETTLRDLEDGHAALYPPLLGILIVADKYAFSKVKVLVLERLAAHDPTTSVVQASVFDLVAPCLGLYVRVLRLGLLRYLMILDAGEEHGGLCLRCWYIDLCPLLSCQWAMGLFVVLLTSGHLDGECGMTCAKIDMVLVARTCISIRDRLERSRFV